MAWRCELTGKTRQIGHRVSHSNRKTKRRFLPNLLNVTLLSDALGRSIRLRMSANALKTVDHRGGLDAFLLKAKDAELSPRVLELKRQVVKKRAGDGIGRHPPGRIGSHRPRRPLDNSPQLRQAGAAIGAGAQRPADIGDARGSAAGQGLADRRKSDAKTGADHRPGLGHSVAAASRKQNAPLALGQNSRFEQRAHHVPLRRRVRRPDENTAIEAAGAEGGDADQAARPIDVFGELGVLRASAARARSCQRSGGSFVANRSPSPPATASARKPRPCRQRDRAARQGKAAIGELDRFDARGRGFQLGLAGKRIVCRASPCRRRAHRAAVASLQ